MRQILFATVIFLVFSTGSASAGENLSRDWLDLSRQCRHAIESVNALEVNGLSQISPRPDISAKHDSRYTRWRLWGSESGRFAILDIEYGIRDGDVRRVCNVKLAPEAAPLSDEEEAVLVRAFLIERAALIADRTHETRNPDPIFPIVPLGYGPIDGNANGCTVITFIMFDPSSNFFTSGTGEEAKAGCSSASFLEN